MATRMKFAAWKLGFKLAEVDLAMRGEGETWGRVQSGSNTMLRVARDMAFLHPDLAGEFLVVNRTINAGISRDDAMHGLYQRTGVEELRGLASSMVQSERLGTSIARILRVYSEALRRKRRQTAEKRAAEASIKMLIPLALFMLPALFALILGPAAMTLAGTLKGVALQ